MVHQQTDNPELPKGNGMALEGYFSFVDKVSDFPQLSSELPSHSYIAPSHSISETISSLTEMQPDCGPRAVCQVVHCHWWWPRELDVFGLQFTGRNEASDSVVLRLGNTQGQLGPRAPVFLGLFGFPTFGT